MNDQIMFKDLENGIYIMKDTRVVEAAGFPDDIKLFGRLVLNGGYLISYIKDIDSNDRYAEFNHKTMKIKYTVKGCVKLMLMDLHINKKKDFEATIIKHLKLKNKRCVNILLNNGLNDRDVKFLKYLPDRIYRIVDNNLKYNNLVSIEMYIENNELKYSYTTNRHIDRSKYDIMSNLYATDVIYYTISNFLKEYETMGIELAPSIEETKPIGFTELPTDKLSNLLDSFKGKSFARAMPTTNDFNSNYYGHPKAFSGIHELKPFRAQTDSARCTMMDEIKNLDAKTLYPKTTNIGGKSIYDEKIVDAYNKFLNIMFDKEKYNGISIRVPKDYDDDWFEVLPNFRFVRNLACKITPELDLYINIKTLGDNGNYIVDISDTDYTFTNNNINNKCIFSDFDRVLTISIIDLQTRLLDILQDSKSNMVDSNVKIKVDNKLDNEIKYIDSEEVKNKVNDSALPVGQAMNNLLRGLPVDYVDNFDLDGDTITHEIKPKNKLTDLKEVKDNDSKVSETDSKPIEETNKHHKLAIAQRLVYDILRSNDFIKEGKIPADAIEYITLLVNGDKGIPNPNKIDNTGYTIRKIRPTQSTFKRLSESDILDKLTANDIIDNSELNMLKNVYDKHMGIVSIRCENDRIMLDDNYRSVFKKHIAKGVLYPKLRFNYDYGYVLNENGIIEYGITRTQIVPFKSMVSNEPINIHKDIMEKYSVLITTQSNMSSAQVGSNVIDSNQVDSCIEIYRDMFSRYIELGILKNTLMFYAVKNSHTFPSIWEIYNDGYIYQNKPTRLYSIYLNMILAFFDNVNLRYAKTTVNGIYKSMFKRYIEVGLMKSEIEYMDGVLHPTLDKLWLSKS